jgi:hypothetical protein
VSELTLSLTFAAACTALITGGLALATNMFADNDKGQAAQFGGTLLVASWLLLAQGKFWEGSGVDGGARGLLLAAIGAGVGSVSYWLNHLLMVTVPTADSFTALFNSVGSHSLVDAGTNAQPSLAGYITFFVLISILRKWWPQSDAFRKKRLAIWTVLQTAIIATALTAIFAFPTVWGTVWAAAISATVQLSCFTSPGSMELSAFCCWRGPS